MTIREKGYHSWNGELETGGFRFTPMIRYGIKAVPKKKFAKFLFGIMTIPFLIFMLALYVSTRPELKMFKGLASWLKWSDGQFFNTFYTFDSIIFIQVILAIFIGAELIANDIKTNSFPLYFSRPLERRDYIFGKFSIVMFYVLLFSIVPSFIIYIFKLIFTGGINLNPAFLLAMILVPLLSASFIVAITLTVSASTSNTRHVKIFVFLIYLFSEGLAHACVNLFKSSYFYMLSLEYNIKQMGTFFFGLKPAFRYPAWLSAVVIAAVVLAAYRIIHKRIVKAEAQIDSSN